MTLPNLQYRSCLLCAKLAFVFKREPVYQTSRERQADVREGYTGGDWP